MDTNQLPVITELDAARIRDLGSRLPDRGERLSALNELIDMVTHEAEIVPSRRVSPDVVTLNSIVSFRDEVTQTVHKVTVVYPQDMSIGERCGRLSLNKLLTSSDRRRNRSEPRGLVSRQRSTLVDAGPG